MIAWKRLFSFFKLTETKRMMILSLVVGVVTGIAAWVFIRAIEISQFWPAVPGQSKFLGLSINRFLIVVIPAVGGLFCGLITQYVSPTAKGTGTADVMYALRRKKGDIAWRHTFFKALASVFTICSGGSAGPEGPVVSIGAGVGSLIGSWRGMTADSRKNLVVAGAAAGFAAVFNAPIAGVLFAIEVLLKEFASEAFAMVILSTVTASLTTHMLMGNRAFIDVPPSFNLNHTWELGFYAILGVATAIIAKLFVQLYFMVEHQFDDWVDMPAAIKPMAGGLTIGLLALVIPSVMGNGHNVFPALVQSETTTPWLWTALLLILAGKLIGVPLTLGSGGSGGIFVPFLLMGAVLGTLGGRLAHLINPQAAPPVAYMLVGMGAMFAGITYAPFTAIILLFEMSRDYNLILPLMLTVCITLLVARALDPESLDSRKLQAKGYQVHETMELRTLEKYHVAELMSRTVLTIPETMPVPEVMEFMSKQAHTGYPVVTEQNKLAGLLTSSDLYQAYKGSNETLKILTAKDIMQTRVSTALPEESLTEAVHRMQQQKADRLIVLDRKEGKIVGILTRSDVLSIHQTQPSKEVIV